MPYFPQYLVNTPKINLFLNLISDNLLSEMRNLEILIGFSDINNGSLINQAMIRIRQKMITVRRFDPKIDIYIHYCCTVPISPSSIIMNL